MTLTIQILAIIACGVSGAILAWLLVFVLGWTGVGGAIAATFVGTAVATLLWAGGVALLRALRVIK